MITTAKMFAVVIHKGNNVIHTNGVAHSVDRRAEILKPDIFSDL